MKKTMLPVLLVLVLLCASCSVAPGSEIRSVSIEDRLAQIDAYKETIPARTEVPVSPSATLSFRDIAFGSTMSDVEAAESQALIQAYSNALDFEPVTVYSYSMQLTYWFNDYDQFYSGAYSMTQNEFLPVMEDLQSHLEAEFGNPNEAGYYYDSTTPVTDASDEEAVAAIDNGEAYYFASYNGPNGLRVELYIEASDSGGYACYIYNSDPAYMY